MIDITSSLQYLSSDPRYAWLAFIVALIPLFHFLAKELPKLYRLIKPMVGSIEEMADAERKANAIMNEIVNEFGADRAGMSLFHNGTKSLANIHFLKVSMIAEGLSGRVGSIMSQSQNRNLAEYGDIGHRIIKDRETICYPDSEVLEETHSGTYVLLKLHLVKSIHIMPIFNYKTLNKEGKPTVDGCVFVEHCVDNVALDQQSISAIQAKAQSVYNELSFVNNGK